MYKSNSNENLPNLEDKHESERNMLNNHSGEFLNNDLSKNFEKFQTRLSKLETPSGATPVSHSLAVGNRTSKNNAQVTDLLKSKLNMNRKKYNALGNSKRGRFNMMHQSVNVDTYHTTLETPVTSIIDSKYEYIELSNSLNESN